MSDETTDEFFANWASIGFRKDGARLKSFSASGRGKTTIVKVEIEVTDPYALGDLVRQLQDAQLPPRPRRSRQAPAEDPRQEDTPAVRLALPAPAPRLAHRGDE